MSYPLRHGRLLLLVVTLSTVLLVPTIVVAPARAQYVAPPIPGDVLPGPQPQPQPPPILPPMVTTKTVAGKVAMLRTDGTAAIPRRAPRRVRWLLRQANRIIGKPYKWGGGHEKLHDRGYDCSGAVSFALIKARMLEATMVSAGFKRWGTAGAGRWISVYAHKSHVYLEVAGLRLDTSSVGDFAQRTGVRWRTVIGQRSGFSARHPVGL